MNTVKKICRNCRTEYNGSPHSWYCNDCKQEIINRQRKTELARIKGKKTECVCAVCGTKFVSYYSKVTCSPVCDRELKVLRQKGRVVKDETKKKIAEKNCLKWHLVSPEGKHYVFDNLALWARDNCNLFGFENSEKNANKIRAGICIAKTGKTARTYRGWMAFDGDTEENIIRQAKNRKKPMSYKAWESFYDNEKNDPNNICRLYKNGNSINSIVTMTGLSHSKIRKILITENLWSNALSVKISGLLNAGKTEHEIADLLNLPAKVINNYSPYSKGEYNWKPSKNALSIKKCKKQKKH